MKKIFLALILFIFMMANICFAAGTIVPSIGDESPDKTSITVVLTCTADASDGSLPDTNFGGPGTNLTKNLNGYYLYEVKIVPGGTGPTDDSDLYIKDSDGIDLLGGLGVDKIDNATTSHFQPSFYPRINSVLTASVSNNSVNGAVFTITLIFTK